jgi:hypothetical protein
VQLSATAARLETLEKAAGWVQASHVPQVDLGAPDQAERLLRQSLTVLAELDSCKTLAEVLTTFASALSSKFARVALFSVRGNRLEGMHQIGFDFQNNISNVAVPLNIDSLLTRAVSSRRSESMTADELTGGAPRSAARPGSPWHFPSSSRATSSPWRTPTMGSSRRQPPTRSSSGPSSPSSSCA